MKLKLRNILTLSITAVLLLAVVGINVFQCTCISCDHNGVYMLTHECSTDNHSHSDYVLDDHNHIEGSCDHSHCQTCENKLNNGEKCPCEKNAKHNYFKIKKSFFKSKVSLPQTLVLTLLTYNTLLFDVLKDDSEINKFNNIVPPDIIKRQTLLSFFSFYKLALSH